MQFREVGGGQYVSGMGRLDGKIALITGGARGQGAAEAERFAAEGATVCITDVRSDEGHATAERLGEAVTFLHHDVTSEADWTAVVSGVVEAEGRIDVLVNNAGIFKIAGALDTSLDNWNRMIAINQTGVFLGIRECGRVGTADEVTNVVLFIASDESSYCNGHEFVVDGAMKA